MNTLEMAMKLRENERLKAKLTFPEGVTWKVKCINGSIMWDEERPKFLEMSNCLLMHDNWEIIEPKKEVYLIYIKDENLKFKQVVEVVNCYSDEIDELLKIKYSIHCKQENNYICAKNINVLDL